MYDKLDNEAVELLNIISLNVSVFRKDKGYSQLKLATEMGYSSASYFGRMELRKDSEHFNIIHLYKIAKILDIPIASFFEPIENSY
jgi:transcriptional regulator with XRE-family HTH domain